MSDIFESTAKKYRGSPAVVVLFVLASAMFFIGWNHFAEDTVSSKIGLEALQTAYGLNVQIFQWSYWTMSLAPQIASMVFFYMYLSDTTKWSFLILSGGSQLMDFFADSWYRSDGKFFDNIEIFSISAILTFIYFSIGSEFFVTVGGGLLLKLAAPALQSWNVAIDSIKRAQAMNYRPEQGQQQHSQKQNQDNHEHKGNRRHENVPVAHDRRAQIIEEMRELQRDENLQKFPKIHQISGNNNRNHGKNQERER